MVTTASVNASQVKMGRAPFFEYMPMDLVQVFLMNGYSQDQIAQLRAIRKVYFDTLYFPTAGLTTPLQLFNLPTTAVDPNGPPGVGRSLEVANFQQPNMLSPLPFVIGEIATDLFWDAKVRQPVGISGDATYTTSGLSTLTDTFMQYAQAGTLKIQVNQKDRLFQDRPFLHLPPGYGPKINQLGAGVKFNDTATLAIDRKRFQWPGYTLVPAKANFAVFLDYPNAAAPALTTVYKAASLAYLKCQFLVYGWEIQNLA